MGFQINTNTAANNAYRTLNNTQTNLSKSLEKLSSGLRINRAADDAAGLAISEGLRSQVNGLSVAANNAQDGVNVVQTAEGGLNQTHAILQRLRDLAVQAGNDSNNTDSRAAIKTESDGLVKELGRIAGSTNFNGINLLDGSNPSLAFQVGADGDANSRINIDLHGANVQTLSNALNGLDSTGTAQQVKTLDSNGITAATVAGQYTITQGTKSVTVDFGAADATRTDADVMAKLQDAAGATFTIATGTAANSFSITSNDVTDTGNITLAAAGGAGLTPTAAASSTDVDFKGLDFTTNSSSQVSIALLDKQIANVSTARASLGASQNRLEYAVQTINVSKENLSASESRIRDTDMASEMVKFTRSNILSQAGTAMLAQANQSGQGVLQLLR